MVDPDLATLFSNCFPNTLDTTVASYTPSTPTSPPSAFVITGDIDAQWLRDSSNQLLPYVRLAAQDAHLQDLICGLIHRHARDVAHDPYANAFNFNASGAGHQDDQRRPAMTPEVFEGKYELDSLAAVLKLASTYYNVTGDKACFLADPKWAASMEILLDTIQAQQVASGDADTSAYLFQRTSNVPTETLGLGGMGTPTPNTGMSRSPFRPSDDATTFPFLIPAQAMAVVELRNLAGMIGAYVEGERTTGREWKSEEVELEEEDSLQQLGHLLRLQRLAQGAATTAAQIDEGIQQYAIVSPAGAAGGSQLYAYEVNGYGSVNLMDDANVPSLLSLPYLGYVAPDDPTYLATRSFVWSTAQPYYWQGTAGRGIGGPHAGMYQIWPMSIIMLALTSTSDLEISAALQQLKLSSAGTGLLHESFDKDDVSQFTRPWFAWVNTLFGELIMKIADERPHLIF